MLDSCELSEFLVQIYEGYNVFCWWHITIWKKDCRNWHDFCVCSHLPPSLLVPSRLQWAGGGPYRAEGCDLQPLLAFKLPLWSQLQLAHPGRSGRGHYHQVGPLTHTHTHTVEAAVKAPDMICSAPVSVTSTWLSQGVVWETGSCWLLPGTGNPGCVAPSCRHPSSPPGGVFGSISTLRPTARGKHRASASPTSEVGWRREVMTSSFLQK